VPRRRRAKRNQRRHTRHVSLVVDHTSQLAAKRSDSSRFGRVTAHSSSRIAGNCSTTLVDPAMPVATPAAT
jgi:hypothetical protein